jgi:predicted O-methyltransferase YrrM
VNVRLNETDLLFPANVGVVREGARNAAAIDAAAAPEGLLEEREGLCLYVLARRAARIGRVVEIGSFKGRSTWFLARAIEDEGSVEPVVAIDPHLEDTAEAFARNVDATGIGAKVDARRAYSHDVVREFEGPAGLVWIDGDHAYDAVARDFADWFPHVAVGGWMAFHDTVNHWHGPTRLVRELLTSRSDLRRVGVMGTITYAQKAAASPRNRVAALSARVAFDAVTWRRGRKMGQAGPLNVAAGEP